jgi:sRNA-binding protein
MKNNKFSNLAAAAQRNTAEATTKKSETGEASQPATNNIVPAAKAPTSQTAADKPEAETRPRTGRPAGKRSNAGFKQVTAYIDLTTYKKVKVRLFEQDEKQEFSELVDTLLKDWLLK